MPTAEPEAALWVSATASSSDRAVPHAVDRGTYNEGDDAGEAIWEGMRSRAPVRVRDGSLDWARSAAAIIDRMGTLPEVAR